MYHAGHFTGGYDEIGFGVTSQRVDQSDSCTRLSQQLHTRMRVVTGSAAQLGRDVSALAHDVTALSRDVNAIQALLLQPRDKPGGARPPRAAPEAWLSESPRRWLSESHRHWPAKQREQIVGQQYKSQTPLTEMRGSRENHEKEAMMEVSCTVERQPELGSLQPDCGAHNTRLSRVECTLESSISSNSECGDQCVYDEAHGLCPVTVTNRPFKMASSKYNVQTKDPAER